mmetsp:Transcript_27578/g.40731  ORF Transcript_27578/g.40731 Transcript_27578/m.40731 type:complete len:297 (+) Transcript_27578:163-1053(+)
MKAKEIIYTIRAMKSQEAGYLSEDYLQMLQDRHENHFKNSNALDPGEPAVDKECRFRMVGWCYQVVDFCEFSRDTVAISINYLDRFMSTFAGCHARTDRRTFQLAAMTCLYTAIKIHEPQALEPKVISELSRGSYTEEEITDMEREILEAMQWRMNPPTPLSFIQAFLSIIPDNVMKEIDREAVTETAKYQTQLAVLDYHFLSCSPSSIAIAALVNAAQGMKNEHFDKTLQTISKALRMDINSQDDIKCRNRLWGALHELPHSLSNKLIPQSSTVSKTIGSTIVGHSPRAIISRSR